MLSGLAPSPAPVSGRTFIRRTTGGADGSGQELGPPAPATPIPGTRSTGGDDTRRPAGAFVRSRLCRSYHRFASGCPDTPGCRLYTIKGRYSHLLALATSHLPGTGYGHCSPVPSRRVPALTAQTPSTMVS